MRAGASLAHALDSNLNSDEYGDSDTIAAVVTGTVAQLTAADSDPRRPSNVTCCNAYARFRASQTNLSLLSVVQEVMKAG